MSRVALVTGGAGFIGSHLAEGLLARGFRVRVLDDLSSGRLENLAPVRERIELIEGDVSRRADVDAAMAGVDVVFHEAAIPSVQRSVEDPAESHRVNLEGTLLALESARKAGVRRFVFAGSSSAYGDSEALPKHEEMRADPLSPYAAQKLASESYCRVFAGCYGLHTVVLRYFNVYGPRQDPSSPYSGVISLFIRALLAKEPPMIYGDGEQTRDFVFVHDVVEANLRAATVDVKPGAVFNVAGGARVSINELFRTIRAAIGGAGRSIEPRHAPARAGDVRHSLADLSSARSELGFEPSVSLVEGVRRTVDDYLKESSE